MIAWLPVIVALIGLVVYYAAPPKAQALGLALFTGGVTGICVAFAGHLVRLL